MYRRKFVYQDKAVAESYYSRRFSNAEGKRENEATKAALAHALESIWPIQTILDMPCGTGRFTRMFFEKGYQYVGGDMSMEMMEVLVREQGRQEGQLCLVRCDAEQLPFKDKVFECVVSIRFLNHIPGEVRRKMLAEMRRVSSKWLIVQSRILKKFGPWVQCKVLVRKCFGRNVEKYQLHRDVRSAGWHLEARVWTGYKCRYVGVYKNT